MFPFNGLNLLVVLYVLLFLEKCLVIPTLHAINTCAKVNIYDAADRKRSIRELIH